MGFSYEDYLYSETAARMGIQNRPSAQQEANIRNILMPVADMVFELAEKLWPGSMSEKVKGGSLHSGFRGVTLNAAIPGASSTSAHCDGLAADIYPMNGKVEALFAAIQATPSIMRLIDQLILERGCVHVGMSASQPRRQIRGEVYVNVNGRKVRTYPLIKVWQES
jgi:hypothetical protein